MRIAAALLSLQLAISPALALTLGELLKDTVLEHRAVMPPFSGLLMTMAVPRRFFCI